ncbi:lysozyme inhibitor LprI family protein [Ralstonia pseudosolanacearum]|uniref:lysozyme inhibitor LprI family protein n=1 Tax=Ralstonia pseudosolanacearum TaxID=1310165 RepID=UPI000E58E114|nr:lysozyme inhibitor LprI family protein [Ralstonia pseudosolanacearum]AXW34208.1 hypothetical protein CJO88_13235 [Ralstonia solanacearum]NKA91417.1 hypothetical protein [Ralstonia solanacearum]NKB15575.1 hypothetical protein [Ralstonia solanacearum]NKF77686.1 hypothetical protein [Ralstonia solanacearum]NKF87734.1 hypothetical protein [Ralstonia solanacearum]
MKKSWILSSGLFALAMCASAGAAEKDVPASDCTNKQSTNLMAMKACSSAEINRLKKEMNVVYSQTLKSLPASRRAALRKSQLAWQKFERVNCDAYIDPNKGQMAPLSAYQCDIDAHNARIIELREKLCTDPVTNCPSV